MKKNKEFVPLFRGDVLSDKAKKAGDTSRKKSQYSEKLRCTIFVPAGKTLEQIEAHYEQHRIP